MSTADNIIQMMVEGHNIRASAKPNKSIAGQAAHDLREGARMSSSRAEETNRRLEAELPSYGIRGPSSTKKRRMSRALKMAKE